jgi:phosphoglucomutase
LSQRQKNRTLPDGAGIISTIVSTKLTREIAKAYGAAYEEVLTGFKHIAKEIRLWEENRTHSFVYGFEESYGYMIGDAVRDKDGVSACMLICEIAAWYKSRGMGIFDAVEEIYQKYGYFKEYSRSITLKGLDGLAKINGIMARLRENLPANVGGLALTEFRDYKVSEARFMATGVTEKIALPVSDVLYYGLEDGSWFCVRPSGTEPKIKVYIGVKATTAANADMALQTLADKVNELIEG